MDLFTSWLIITAIVFSLSLFGIVVLVKIGHPGFLMFFGFWLAILLILGAYFLPPEIASQDTREGICAIGGVLAFFGAIGSFSVIADTLGF
ncbi:MAG: hypothetical protein UX02_C0003G0086 [Candidatus Moranbacteria bacterium GW2011_GWC1_45_18]|nr:MAG: hypothetical protein UT79_C0004G0087 [Candidatus Moranbacteria bacterium GW2011_GWC2_40_12]KKT31329.1 MAG: hypothetical protein UW19_C0036G0010 [Candidatus Moranbacteria bacterium GW2011_GWF2_44_10]KKT69854.1 MAG: hypothetical protein UW66_C0059G0004 [Candidatus Moranbacteria bacterium GW2011_GWF1_44_4]KKT99543.1 MAG: hypothetical protein UX02_C0003G0086 [Candidatus Moranbacteria bacterium GW2011_GWC1_45_18]OGI23746.1 MAG: hypothetical protein A2194_00595 [Candidatus Moranbacteria bacte